MNTRFNGSPAPPAEADRRAVSVLLALLRDSHPAIRTGAIFGLVALREIDGVLERLREVEREDTSADVRLSAALALHAV